MARTLAESGISLLIGNLGSGLDSGRGFLLMGLEISSITPKEFFFTFLYVGTITYTVFYLGNIFGDICSIVYQKCEFTDRKLFFLAFIILLLLAL